MKYNITVERECVCCGALVDVVLSFDLDINSRPTSSDCICGCSLDLRVVDVEQIHEGRY